MGALSDMLGINFGGKVSREEVAKAVGCDPTELELDEYDALVIPMYRALLRSQQKEENE